MKRFSLGMQLGAVFAIMISMMSFAIGYGLYQFKADMEEMELLNSHTVARVVQIKEAQADFTRALLDMRGFLFYPDGQSAYEQGYRGKFKRSMDNAAKFHSTSTIPEIKQTGERLLKLLAGYNEFGDKVIAAKKANDPNLPAITSQGRQMVADIDKTFAELSELQTAALNQKSKSLVGDARQDIWLTAGLALLIFTGTIVAAVIFSRQTVKRIRRVSGDLANIGRLDLSGPDVQPTKNDEIGDMGKVLIEMKHNLKGFVRQIQSSADTLAASGEELTATVEENKKASEGVSQSIIEIAAGTSANSDSVSAISATLEELSASTQEMSANSGEVNQNTQAAVVEIRSGMGMLGHLSQQSAMIADAMQNITEVTRALEAGSKQIQGIVEVINNLAGQTNLLALNAAIEAARAGEAGRGFAVVAEEVRKLAEQSAGATEDISQIINTMSQQIGQAVASVTEANAKVADGKTAAETTRSNFTGIAAKLEEVKNRIEQISLAVDETAKGAQSMVSSIEVISSVASDTSNNASSVAAIAEEQSASMNEISGQAESLSHLAIELEHAARKFKL